MTAEEIVIPKRKVLELFKLLNETKAVLRGEKKG